MAALNVDGANVEVRFTPLEVVGALHRSFRVPLDDVSWVEYVPSARAAIRGLRAPGTGVPGVVALGTFRYGTDCGSAMKDLVAAYGDRPGYVLHLRDQPYVRLIVSSDHVPALEAAVANAYT